MSSLDTDTPVKVLLVEDDEDDAIITQTLLEKSTEPRFELDWARSFDAGLTRIKDHYDISLIDYNLGSKTGIDFLREAHSENPHIPIIMLTGQGDESLVIQALESGAIDYIPKRNISTENLQRIICNGIEKIRLQAELSAYRRQLEQTNAVLQKRTDEIQRFYHLLAHELKTPLTAASEFVNILLEGITGTLKPKQAEYLRLVKGCHEHLNRNIDDLYEITRLETGKLSIHLQAESLSQLIADVVNYLTPKAQSKGIMIRTSMAPNLPHVMMDSQRIRQVLLNLVDNALRFSEQSGTIVIQAYEDPHCPDRVRVNIQDTGMGIPPDQLKEIFERLYQVEKEPSATSPGLGLGLYICRELIQLHNGTMSVASTLGQGSTFHFTLQCAHSHQRSTP